MRAAVLQRLHVRLALVVVGLLIVVFAGLMWLLRYQSFQAVLETSQRQNLQLANSIALMQPRDLIGIDGKADVDLMRSLAKNVMKINPSIEVYLLDGDGTVLAHALDGEGAIDAKVNLTPVRRVALPSIGAPRFPVLGDDPRRPAQPGVFSATPLGRGVTPDGYLYVMLGGANRIVHGDSPVPDTLRTAGLGMLALLLVAVGTIAWVLRYLTRPLRQLTQNVLSFKSPPNSQIMKAATSEIQVLDTAIRSMQARITGQVSELKKQDLIRRELISNVSHDLRTPLANIQGYVETMLIDIEPGKEIERRECLETTLRQARRLTGRVDELFELSKLDSGGVVPRLSSFCLAELVQDVLSSYHLPAQKRGVSIEFAPGARPESEAYADIALIERVLQNLIDNAMKYTPANGVIRVGIQTGDGQSVASRLIVQIANSGAGIASHDIPHLFERYWRGPDPDSLSVTQSAGLGLAIVKRILDLHDSSIQVRSTPGQQTVFEFGLLPTATILPKVGQAT